MQLALLYVAAAFFVVKIASTIWLVCQPDAATVTANTRGFAICHASQLSAILFVAAMLARTCVEGGPPGYIAFRALLLVVATAMVTTVIRQRAAGEWYGCAHVIKQGRRRRHDHPGEHDTWLRTRSGFRRAVAAGRIRSLSRVQTGARQRLELHHPR